VINVRVNRLRTSVRAAGRLTLVATILVGSVCAGAASPGLAAEQVRSLGEGQSQFWDGAYVSSARIADPSLCGTEGGCIDYKVAVSSAHARVLRAGLQTPDESNNWALVLLDPSGHAVASGTTYMEYGLGQNFHVEVWARNPAPGTWTIRAVPENVQNGTFEMRAAVDPVIAWPSTDPEVVVTHTARIVRTCKTRRRGHHMSKSCVTRRVHRVRDRPRTGLYDVPPDLAADAPWSLTFAQPTPMVAVESGNVLAAAGLHHASATVAGQPLYNCLPEETAEQGARRCLRFSSGFGSLGPGKFEVYGSSSTPVAPNGGPLYQDVYRSDGSHYSRHAGSFIFHDIHAHYHVLGIAQFHIYRVLAPGKLVSAGTVLKEGFCLGNVKIFNWNSFAQSEIDPNSQDNCEPSPQPDGSWRFYEGIAPGWEDVYVWQTSGQFVDFASDPDGNYLLRVVVNPDHYLLEADTGHDNNDVAYTYFRVTGNDVRVIERGRGSSPWDPSKQILDPTFGEG
jgi:hypothetical protein